MRNCLFAWIGYAIGVACFFHPSLTNAGGHVTFHTTYTYFVPRSPGGNCVGATTAVGDEVRIPGGATAPVVALYGKSAACKDPRFPINAKLGAKIVCPTATPFNIDAGIDLPDGWSQVKQSCTIANKGYFFFALNKSITASLLISDRSRSQVGDMMSYAKSKRDAQMANLDAPSGSDIEQLVINDMQAWRFEVTGVSRTNKKSFTYLITLIDSGKEVVALVGSMPKDLFPEHREELEQLASQVKGLSD